MWYKLTKLQNFTTQCC